MSTAVQWFESTAQQLRNWSLLKKLLMIIALLTFLTSSFLFLTGPGTEIRIWMAQTVIITQHRDWAWMFVGPEKRDDLVRQLHANVEENALEKQNMNLIKPVATRKNRSIDELIKVEDISGKLWKGKRMYVFDPKSIRIMTPEKSGEGERISSMVKRTGAVAGVNAGGFTDPEGLGNGFAAIGAIISGGDIIFTDQDGSVKQHIVGFTKDGTLVIGKYDMFELEEMGISEAASFYPRVIANGKPLPINDNSRAPRTAVGQKADGTVIFIVVDGRQVHSVGATLKEIQDMFLEDDVINAGFLDGGASSELVVNGEVVTKPSSRYGERRLPSAFLVYDDPDSAVANRVWDGVDKIDAGGSYDHPDFLREQAELKAKQKNNPTPTPTSTPTPTPPPKKTDTGTNGSKGTTGSNDSDTKESSDKGSTPKPTPTPTPGHNNGSGNSTPDPNKPSTGGNATGNEGAATPTPTPKPTTSPSPSPTSTPTTTPSATPTPTPKPGNEPQNGNNGTAQPPKANNGGSAGAPGASGNTPDAPGTTTPKPTPTPAAGSGTGAQQQ